MIKFENIEVTGWEPAIRGMRNPLESWDKSDSYPGVDCDKCGKIDRPGSICYREDRNCTGFECYIISPNDLDLMKRLCKAGSDHRKFMRMIVVYVDIEASHTWWAEFDTYKVATVRNSCSKMHKIHVHPFTYDMFDHEGIDEVGGFTRMVFNTYLKELENLRVQFNETKEKKYWRALIEMLPLGFRLRATIMMSYEVLANIRRSRKGHKLDEWSKGFMEFIDELPYSELIDIAAGYEKEKNNSCGPELVDYSKGIGVCPGCKKVVGDGDIKIFYCKHCGKKLQRY